MKKALYYIFAAVMLAACSSEELEYQYPDNYTDEIAFSAGEIVNGILSRADESYEAYDAAKHADNLGVFGMSSDGTNKKTIFTNEKMHLVTENAKSLWKVVDDTKKHYWSEYNYETSFDFFGYMYEADLPNATLSNSGSSYTLSYPAEIAKPILTSPDNTPLICNAPIHRNGRSADMEFKMDQTLAGFNVYFALGDKMDKVRDFKVKSVTVKSDAYPTSGTVSRTYNYSDGTWTSENITWSNLGASAAVTDTPLDWGTNTLLVTGTDFKKWGDADATSCAFYVIPSTGFKPTIEVVYDVVFNSTNGEVVTRNGVKSSIQLRESTFSGYTGNSATGKITPIKIKIVPDYLYVLADGDQTSGVLVIK